MGTRKSWKTEADRLADELAFYRRELGRVEEEHGYLFDRVLELEGRAGDYERAVELIGEAEAGWRAEEAAEALKAKTAA